MRMPDRILLRSVEFYGYHGVPEAERRTGHRYSVDVAIDLDLSAAAAADDLSLTVDYSDLCARVVAIGEGQPVRLLETLADRIAAACLAEYPAVTGVEVVVRKLLPPLPHVVASAEVRLRRERDRA
jgi:dihydroneopterin aldolase